MVKLAVVLIIQLNGNTIANWEDAINSGIISGIIFISNKCKIIIWIRYGGCGGNDNRFETIEDCESKCVSPPGTGNIQ